MKRLTILVCVLGLLTSLMCIKDKELKIEYDGVEILLKSTGPGYQGSYYPNFLQVKSDYAIWIEDANRNFIKTIEITPTAVTVNEAQGSHIEHLPNWMAASGLTYTDLQAETQDGLAPSFDGLTGASPFFESDTVEQTFTVVWDLTDASGEKVTGNTYFCVAEMSNLIKDGDMTANTIDRFEINAETLYMRINLGDQKWSMDSPTTHLKEMSAEFIMQSSLEKTITGP